MTAIVLPLRAARVAVLAAAGLLGALGPALAVPPTLNTSGLTPEQCYRKDSDCTQFCGEVTGDLRYECFGICDRMLDRCLSTGDWTDSAQIDPGTGNPPDRKGLLSGFFVRMLTILADTNGDGVLSPDEIRAIRDRAYRGAEVAPPKGPAQQ